jgi:hypothetical protein
MQVSAAIFAFPETASHDFKGRDSFHVYGNGKVTVKIIGCGVIIVNISIRDRLIVQ